MFDDNAKLIYFFVKRKNTHNSVPKTTKKVPTVQANPKSTLQHKIAAAQHP
jgi:hypothetical protein